LILAVTAMGVGGWKEEKEGEAGQGSKHHRGMVGL
jgi:hypothetical protein